MASTAARRTFRATRTCRSTWRHLRTTCPREGSAAGRINIRTLPGSNYINRTSSVVFNAPQLEWTDATGRALGQRYTNANVGGAVSGPFALDKAFYSIAYQAGRRGNDLHTLLNTDSLGLEADGIAVDSL